MTDVLSDRRVAILAADGVERVELEQPRQAVEDEDVEEFAEGRHSERPVGHLPH